MRFPTHSQTGPDSWLGPVTHFPFATAVKDPYRPQLRRDGPLNPLA